MSAAVHAGNDRPATRHATSPTTTVTPRITADVAVIGAGPAGIAAAARAAEAGRRVVVLDAAPNAGGQIWRHRSGGLLDADAHRWLARLARTSAEVYQGVAVVDATASLAGSATGSGTPDGFTLVAEPHRGDGAVTVRARTVVIATGARERFLPFPGWTLPGVLGIGGAQALLKQGASFAGKRVVIAGSGPLMLPVAASLARAGARVRLVAEQAPPAAVRELSLSLLRHPGTLVQAAVYRLAFIQAPYATGTWVTEAVGGDRVRQVVATDGRTTRAVPCDMLCTGYGLVPNIELPRLLGCDTATGVTLVGDRQETSLPGVFAAGEVTGVGGVALAVVEGEIAGAAAAGVARIDPSLVRRRAALRETATSLDRAFALRPELRALPRSDTIVCRCEDVRHSALAGLRESRQAKLYTRAGMGACQGRVCGPALELLFGWPRDTVRPPLEPARLSTLSASAAAMAPAVAAEAPPATSSPTFPGS